MNKPATKKQIPVIAIATSVVLLLIVGFYIARLVSSTSISFIQREEIVAAHRQDDSLIYVNQDSELKILRWTNNEPEKVGKINGSNFSFSPNGDNLSYTRDGAIYYTDPKDPELTEQRLISGGTHSWIDEDNLVYFDFNNGGPASELGEVKTYGISTRQTETVHRNVALTNTHSLVDQNTVVLVKDESKGESDLTLLKVGNDNSNPESFKAVSFAFGNGILAFQDNDEGQLIKVIGGRRSSSTFSPNRLSVPYAPIDENSFIYQAVEGTNRVIKIFNEASANDKTILELDNLRYVQKITVLGETILLSGRGGTYVVEL
jgi:hypothetical protein